MGRGIEGDVGGGGGGGVGEWSGLNGWKSSGQDVSGCGVGWRG